MERRGTKKKKSLWKDEGGQEEKEDKPKHKENNDEERESKEEQKDDKDEPQSTQRDSILAPPMPSTSTKRDHEARSGSPAPPVLHRAARRAVPVLYETIEGEETEAKDTGPKIADTEPSKARETETGGTNDTNDRLSKVEVVEPESHADPATVSQELSTETSKVESQPEPVSQEVAEIRKKVRRNAGVICNVYTHSNPHHLPHDDQSHDLFSLVNV
ncbi:hypothetical protein M422DRAFT_65804 [Sphaerobolus stellatus SS14]|nr:hypothetical protein M422DRAFT_65804 [Sphaerobolus stellatus SS14]